MRSATPKIELIQGKQIVKVAFEGQQIGDNAVDGPYQVIALWASNPDVETFPIVDPAKMLAYQELFVFDERLQSC